MLSEGLAVDRESGEVLDLTIRSFGIIRARDLPPVHRSEISALGKVERANHAVLRPCGYPHAFRIGFRVGWDKAPSKCNCN